MGKGDKKTRRGKIYRSSYGGVRPHKAKRGTVDQVTTGGPARKTTRRRKPA